MSANPAFVLRGIEDVIFEDRPIPRVSDDDVLVEVKKTGICGSDVHYLLEGRIGDFVVEKPMVLGHESAGIIAKSSQLKFLNPVHPNHLSSWHEGEAFEGWRSSSNGARGDM